MSATTNKQKAKTLSPEAKRNGKIALVSVGVVIIVLGAVFWPTITSTVGGWIQGLVITPDEVETTETDRIYILVDVVGNTAILELDEDELSEVSATRYYCDISDMDAEEIAELTYADFTAETAQTNVESDDELDLKEDEISYFYISHADCWPIWLTDYVPGEINPVDLVNKTSGVVNAIAFESDGDSTNFNLTAEDEWTVTLIAETTDDDWVNGYPASSYDFTLDCWNRTGFRVLLNTTAKGSYCQTQTAGWIEVASGNYLYYFYNGAVLSSAPVACDLIFDDDLGVEYECISITPIWGSVEGEITAIGSAIV